MCSECQHKEYNETTTCSWCQKEEQPCCEQELFDSVQIDAMDVIYGMECSNNPSKLKVIGSNGSSLDDIVEKIDAILYSNATYVFPKIAEYPLIKDANSFNKMIVRENQILKEEVRILKELQQQQELNINKCLEVVALFKKSNIVDSAGLGFTVQDGVLNIIQKIVNDL